METEQPVFQPGLIVTEPSLVTDAHGKAWWVDPQGEVIRAAKAEEGED